MYKQSHPRSGKPVSNHRDTLGSMPEQMLEDQIADASKLAPADHDAYKDNSDLSDHSTPPKNKQAEENPPADSKGKQGVDGGSKVERLQPDLEGEIENLIPMPVFLPGEDPMLYDVIRNALIRDLKPAAGYEAIIVEDIVAAAWEILRHRRIRDHEALAEYRNVVVQELRRLGNLGETTTSDDVAHALMDVLTCDDANAHRQAETQLAQRGIKPDEIMARVFERHGENIERHDRAVGRLLMQRRRLHEELSRLQKHRDRRCEDAELVS